MLIATKDYLAVRKEVTVRDVAAHFSVSADTARALLDHWVRKGKVVRASLEQCRQCALHCGKSWEAYQWIDQSLRKPRRSYAPRGDPDELLRS